MAWGKPLSPEQLLSILDNAPVAVYVSAMDNQELLYANCKAKQLFLKQPKSQGIRCYEAAGFKNPCPFCQTAKMVDDELLIREFQHPENDNIYELSGKVIDWNGRKAHIEYVMDITDKRRKEAHANQSIEEIKATFCNVPTGLCIYRVENEQIMPLFHNPAFFNIMGFTDEELEKALPPIASIISKCEKAQSKYSDGSAQYKRYINTIDAMTISKSLIDKEIERRINSK